MKYRTEVGNRRRQKYRQDALELALKAGLLGGGAYGSYRLGEWFLPQETRHLLKNLNETVTSLQRRNALAPESIDPREVIGQYARQGSALAQARVGNWQGKDLVKFIRTALPVKNKWTPHFSDAHYDAFARGPAYGAAQLIDEHAHDMWHKLGEKEREGLGPDFTPTFFKRLGSMSKDLVKRDMTKGMTSLREGLAYQGVPLSAQDQEKMLQGLLYDPALNPPSGAVARVFTGGFRKKYGDLQKSLASGLIGSSFPNYKMIGDYANAVRKGLSIYAPAALGVGAAGLGALGAYKLLKSFGRTPYEKMRQREEIERMEREGSMSKAAGLQAALLKCANPYNVQQMMPIGPRRELSPEENANIERESEKWIPKIFENLSHDPTVRLADPGRQALLYGLGAGLPVTALASGATMNPVLGLGAGATVGGIAALLGYLGRKQKNEDIVETMRRLPAGARLRDFESDPLMAERRNQQFQRRLAMMQNQLQYRERQ